jgi:NADH-quinone oxidoreductase subunit M
MLIALLIAGTLTPVVELRDRGRPTRIFVLHMILFAGLLIVGWASVDSAVNVSDQTAWATVPLLAAVLVRCGAVPVHIWLTDWIDEASFGNAVLFVTPLTGVFAAVRLVLPIAPDWVLHSLGVISLMTAIYAAGMTLVQLETRRFFAFLFLSHSSLVLVGIEWHSPVALTASLYQWLAVALSLGGFGLTLRALESRVGRLNLTRFHGLYDLSPSLAICFLLTGLASVGFPGTIGFIATEMLIDSAVGTHLVIGLLVIAATALNGIAVVRAYLLLFTGRRRESSIQLHITPRERFAVLSLTALIVGAGLNPMPGVANRFRAAEDLLRQRGLHETPRATDPNTPQHIS